MARMRPIARLCCALFWLAALAPCAASPACDASAAREKARLDRVGERLDKVLADGRLPDCFPQRGAPARHARRARAAGGGRVRTDLPSARQGPSGAALGRRGSRGPHPGAAFRGGGERIGGRGARRGRACHGQFGPWPVRRGRQGRRGRGARRQTGTLGRSRLRRAVAGRSSRFCVARGNPPRHCRGPDSLDRPQRRRFPGGGATQVAAFERAGFSDKTLENRRVRARGVVEIGVAPQIDLFHPSRIEFMEEASQTDSAPRADSPERR